MDLLEYCESTKGLKKIFILQTRAYAEGAGC